VQGLSEIFERYVKNRIIAEAILGNDERLRIFEGLKVPSFYGGKSLKKLATKIGTLYYKFLDRYR